MQDKTSSKEAFIDQLSSSENRSPADRPPAHSVELGAEALRDPMAELGLSHMPDWQAIIQAATVTIGKQIASGLTATSSINSNYTSGKVLDSFIKVFPLASGFDQAELI